MAAATSCDVAFTTWLAPYSFETRKPLVDDVDPDQRVGATEAGQPKRDQADHALAVDGDRFADRDLRPPDSVEGHVAEDRECRRGVVDLVRHRQQTVFRGLCVAPRAPSASRASGSRVVRRPGPGRRARSP